MENKFGRYFKYAIGEIILVVIGILIALQVNNWNTKRLDKIKEQIYLQALTIDLNKDALVLKQNIEAIDTTIAAQGLAKIEEIAYLRKGIKKELQQYLNELIEDQKMIQVKVDGELYYTHVNSLNNTTHITNPNIHIINPFDNILIQITNIKIETYSYEI